MLSHALSHTNIVLPTTHPGEEAGERGTDEEGPSGSNGRMITPDRRSAGSTCRSRKSTVLGEHKEILASKSAKVGSKREEVVAPSCPVEVA